jgi:hypothetical protein
MTSVQDAMPKKPLPTILVRRTGIALALFALIIVPAAVLLVITKQPSATYASMGALIGAFAVLAGGLRIGILTSLVAALLAPIAIVAGLSPITGAALMILMTLIVGRLSMFGLHRATMLVPIFLAWPMLSPIPWLPKMELGQLKTVITNNGLTLTEALSKAQASGGGSSSGGSGPSTTDIHHAMVDMRLDTTYLTWVIAFFFLGAIVPAVLLHFVLRKRNLPSPKPNPRSEALNYTITICVLTGVAMYYFIDHPKQTSGSFFIATILVLTQVGSDIEWKLTLQRVVGTFGGLVALMGLMALMGHAKYTEVVGIPMPVNLYIVGAIFGVGAIVAKFSPRQWMYYILITPTAALLNAYTMSAASDIGKQRLVDNLVGAALVIIAAGITIAAGRLKSTSTPNQTAVVTS